MKKIIPLLIICLFALNIPNVLSQEKDQAGTTENIKVYYFHMTHRCATCMAVEKTAQEALEKNYPDELKNKSIEFVSVNLEDEDSEDIAKEMNVNSQTLLIVKGDKKEDLTTFAFMNARSDPDKVYEKIKETIDSL